MENGRKRGSRRWLVALVAALSFAATFALVLSWRFWPMLQRPPTFEPMLALPSPLDLVALPTAERFDFPMGSEHGAMSYNATYFTEDNHLGDDWNGIGGENSDLGNPIYAIADGRALLVRDVGGGWGKVLILLHVYEENGERRYVQSFYGHCDTILVQPGDYIRRGQQIATVGTADGRYLAHLHLEMREFLTPFIGAGYRLDPSGWINPTEFIRAHRGAPEDDVGRPPLP